jgi:ABC-2 type transport system ATP-binding protein
MEIVAFTTKPGSKLTLQLVATTVAYAEPRLGGSVDFTKIDLSLPTAAGLTPAAG